MEKNVDVFSLVISKLNDNDMWFTTKADPTVEEARNYYKLDEYGNPTETTINKIVKEVNALIGDGAINEYDAVDLWINDALVAYTVDYRDNLVTQFEDKPVVDGIEAYENSVQFPKSKKVENKKERFYVQGPDEFDIENGLEDTPSWDIMDSNTDDFYYDEDGNNYHFYSEDEAIKACKKLNSKKVESRKIIEGVLKNIQLEDEIDGWKVYTADVDTKLGKNIIATFKNYEDDEGNVITNIRIDYNTSNNKYIVNYVDNDGIFHQIDYELSDDELSQIAGSKKVEAKTKKTEGAGAGYTVSGTLTNIGVNSYEILDTYVDNSDYGGQEKCFVLKCDIDVDIEDMKFSSYEYGGEIEFPVKAKITNLVLFDYDYDEDSSENVEIDEAGIIGALEDITFEDVLGAGWLHQAFTGTFETSVDGSSYSVLTADNCTISIDNETVIDYIDNKVTGNIDLYTYAVLDEEGKELKDDFSDEKEAIKYAQEHNGVTVDRIYHNWKLIDANGNLDDEPENEVIWERDYDKHYKYDNEVNESKKVKKENIDNHKYKSEYDELDDLLDTYAGIDNGKLELYNAFNNDSMKEFDDDEYDMWLEDMKNEHFDELMEFLKEKDEETSYYMSEINESKKVTEEFWEDGEKYEYKGIVIQQSISDRGKKIYSILNHQEPFSIPYFSSLRVAKQYIDNNNLKSYKVTESYHKRLYEVSNKRLYEVNNKSKNLISSMFADSSFDSDSPAGQIVMRTSEMFNALSDKGYDVEVAFDNGESTSAIQLGQQGGKVMITITNTDKPLRAFTSGNIEVTAESIKTLQDIQTQIDVL